VVWLFVQNCWRSLKLQVIRWSIPLLVSTTVAEMW
jgi:hypothetical protein